MTGYVYIMASKRNGTLYTGVTSDIEQRVYEHREGLLPGFTRKYGCKMLVWYEEHFDVADAIQREKSIKRYYRKWKLNLIEAMNPNGKTSMKGSMADWVLGTSPRMTTAMLASRCQSDSEE